MHVIRHSETLSMRFSYVESLKMPFGRVRCLVRDVTLTSKTWGYLIGDLGNRKLSPKLITDVQISVGEYAYREMLPLQTPLTEISRNMTFPRLRRNREIREVYLSQLLQIATLPYI